MHSLRHLRCIFEMHWQTEDVVERIIALTSLERCGGVLRDRGQGVSYRGDHITRRRRDKTHDHLVDENSECPPIYG